MLYENIIVCGCILGREEKVKTIDDVVLIQELIFEIFSYLCVGNAFVGGGFLELLLNSH